MALLEIKDLNVNFSVASGKMFAKADRVSAVSQLDLTINKGEFFGVVGESGCGKTTLANAILGFVTPLSGEIKYDGEYLFGEKFKGFKDFKEKRRKKKWIKNERAKKMQVVFQDPFSSFNPRMQVFDIITESMYINGEHDINVRKTRALELLKLVGLSEEDLERNIADFSGGQRQRIAIARALCSNPEFIVLDEPLSALDVSVQAMLCNLLQDLQKELNLTYLFISHNLAVVRHLTERVAVMYLGHVVEYGSTEKIFASPKHPYTKLLLETVPNINNAHAFDSVTLGETKSPINMPTLGCRFKDRCGHATKACDTKAYGLVEVDEGHFVACCRAVAHNCKHCHKEENEC